MKVLSTEKVRHLILRAGPGDTFPEALANELRDQAVTCGWVRGGGVLRDVSIRAYAGDGGGLAPSRHFKGPIQLISLEGSVGLAAGDISLGLRAVLGRETDRGMETLAGEIVNAKVVAVELLVAAFDEHAAPRALDPTARVWLLADGDDGTAGRNTAPTTPPPPAWSEAVAASAVAERPKAEKPVPAPAPVPVVAPPKPIRTNASEEPSHVPEAGDVVDHFAFGKCDVLKSEDDRLYLRMHKDGRIKEIALEMLKVTPLDDEDGKKSYKLARKL